MNSMFVWASFGAAALLLGLLLAFSLWRLRGASAEWRRLRDSARGDSL